MPSLLDYALKQRAFTVDGAPRRMGVEIELAGVEPNLMATQIQDLLGGTVKWTSPFEITVGATKLGDFKLELDSQMVIDIGQRSVVAGDPEKEPEAFSRFYIKVVSALAESVVPWEIVSPPIELAKLDALYELTERLHAKGAMGTRDAVHFAFGVHLNPELVDLEPTTIVSHLKSFFCLYEWIRTHERTDLSRRITPYINHFAEDYIALVLAPDYQPNQQQLIADYLAFNPTRNRSLDMLPLFAHLDEKQVRSAVADERVNARPTFHYRLPNCDIGNPDWNLHIPVEMWMAVEAFAYSDNLQNLCDQYLTNIDKLLPTFAASWAHTVNQALDAENLLPDFITN